MAETSDILVGDIYRSETSTGQRNLQVEDIYR